MDKTNNIQYNLEDLRAMIEASLEVLRKDRDREVLTKRHGVLGNKPQTLEQIGQQLGITRERVRQIEKAALARIRQENEINPDFSNALIAIIDKKGGVIRFEQVVDRLTDQELAAELSFIIRTNPKFYYLDKNDLLDSLVVNAEVYSEEDVKDLHQLILVTTKELGKPGRFERIAGKIDGPHKAESLMEIAHASAKMAELEENWGLSHWPEVNPKSIRDKVYLVLKKNGRPMHFSDIAAKLDQVQANPKKVTTQAVHNELIKDKRFVLIGRGIYALAEWGYQAGTVADIIEGILKEESPLTKDEIVRRVLARRQVKVTTIALNLQEKPQFERVAKATYQLKKA
jgi:DNA-directed RNA polymerase delta subunit